MSSSSDQNLLFGILALKMNFVSRDQLVAATTSWVEDQSRRLTEIMVEQGALSAEDHDLLAPLVDRHIVNHGGDPQRSLAALSSIGSAATDLRALGDGDIDATLSMIATDPAANDCDETLTHDSRLPFSSVGAVGDSAGSRFHIIRSHARGGLGEVYLARDAELNREVALKEIHGSHADDETSRQRFLLEAEVTGGLEHPGIVPVYGLGRYDDGRPYYAMRFIQGDSLRDAADQFHGGAKDSESGGSPDVDFASVEFRKLLGRFVDVCQAIEYAHSRGVLHRDLKPGNIMLGKYGETLVVDWGLAKTTGSDGVSDATGESPLQPTSSGHTPTLAGHALGTPAFMPPEQAAGDLDALGPASDVYSLGATLYYVLAGRSAFTGLGLQAVLEAVGAGRFPAPSSVCQGIPKALEAICLRAMSTKPGDRYASPQQLADDVERYLADEPVSAHTESLTIRARRWLRKNSTLAAGLLATLFVGLSSAVVISVVVTGKNGQLKRANEDLGIARDRAVSRSDIAVSAIEKFQRAVEENVDVQYRPDLAKLRDTLLAVPEQFYSSMRTELLASEDTSLESRLRLANVYNRVGRLSQDLRSHASAAESYQEAVEILEPLCRENDQNLECLDRLAAARHGLGAVGYGNPELANPLEEYDESIRLRRRIAEQAPDDLENSRRLAVTLRGRGTLLRLRGELDEADVMFETSLSRLKECLTRDPDAETRKELVVTYLAQAGVRDTKGQHREALAILDGAYPIARKLADNEDAPPGHSRPLAELLKLRWKCLDAVGEPGQGMLAATESVDLLEGLRDKYPTSLPVLQDLANANRSAAIAASEVGESGKAIEYDMMAITLLTQLSERNPANVRARTSLTDAYLGLGMHYYAAGRKAEAIDAFFDTVPIYESLVELEPDNVQLRRSLGGVHYNIGYLLAEQQRLDEAFESYGRSLDVRRALSEANPDQPVLKNDVAFTLGNVSRLHQIRDEFRLAIEKQEQARDIQQKLHRDYPETAQYVSGLSRTEGNLSQLYRATGRYDEAKASLAASLETLEGMLEANRDRNQLQRDLAAHHRSYGNLHSILNEFPEAHAEYDKSIAIYESLLESSPDEIINQQFLAKVYADVAGCFVLEERYEDAIPRGLEAIEADRVFHERDPRDLESAMIRRTASASLAQAYARLGRLDEAREAWRASVEANHDKDEAAADEVLADVWLLLWAGDHTGAVAALDRSLPDEPAATVKYQAARILATACGDAADDDAVATACAQRAVSLLRSLSESGDLTANQRAEVLFRTTFESFRSRPESALTEQLRQQIQ